MVAPQRRVWLAVNRAVWMVALAGWFLVLAVGTYLGRIHLRPLGAVTLAITGAAGLGYVLTTGSRWQRSLGLAANGLLLLEMGLHAAGQAGAPAAWAGFGAAILFLGVPFALLLRDAGEVD